MGSFPDIQIVNHFDKKNYGPVCILPLLSKVYERGIYKEYTIFLNFFLVKFCVDLEKHLARNKLCLN